jgi:hypothetical protein
MSLGYQKIHTYNQRHVLTIIFPPKCFDAYYAILRENFFVYAQNYCHNFVITYICQHAVLPETLYDSSPLPASISNLRFLFKYKNLEKCPCIEIAKFRVVLNKLKCLRNPCAKRINILREHNSVLIIDDHVIYTCVCVCMYVYTGYTQKNGAVSKVNKKFISHLTRAQPTPSAATTVQVSHALPAVRFSCLLRGPGASFQDGIAPGKCFLCAPF